MLPQRRISPGIAPKAPLRAPSKALLSPKGILRSPRSPLGISPKTPWRGPSKTLLSSKGGLGIHPKSKKALPKKPGSIFEEKKHWNKRELRQMLGKLSPFLMKDKVLKKHEIKKMIEEWFPHERFGTHIETWEARKRLREYRSMEDRERTKRGKLSHKFNRVFLEALTRRKKY